MGCRARLHHLIQRRRILVFRLKRALAGPIVFVVSLHAHGQVADETKAPDAAMDSIAAVQNESRQRADEYVPAWHEMVTRVPGDWTRFAGENFQSSRIPAILGLAGLTAALVVADDPSWRSTESVCNRTQRSRDIMHSFAELGNGRTVLAVAGAFALGGWMVDDPRALRTASQMVESYLASGITVQVLKHLTGRERPERQSRKGGAWRFFPNQAEYHRSMPKFDAFPSGHTAGAMGMVTVLIENYPELKWLRPVGYAAVGLVTISLVSRGWHWYSDFPLAIVLGYQFGMIASHPEHDEDEPAGLAAPRSTKPSVSLLPSLGEHGAGVTLAVTF